MKRTLAAGFFGGLGANLAMLLTFRTIGFGWDAKGILLSSPIQSKKLIAVWTETVPLPLVVTHPLPIIFGIILFGIAHAFIYRSVSRSWPEGLLPRGFRMTGLVFVMTYLFWEFFTPFNQFGEPLPLILLELLFWAVIAATESFIIVSLMEEKQS
jgi:hypothetical protein